MLRFTLIFFAFLQSVSANAAVVAVCESLVAGDHFLSERIKLDYVQSSDLALADFARQFPGSNHEIKYNLEPNDPVAINKVIINFVKKSVESGAKNIDVIGRLDGVGLYISVADDGPL